MSTQPLTRGLRTLAVVLALAAPALAWPQQDPQYGRDYIIVTPGMTLTRIMREYYAQHRQHWPVLMDEIIRLNPHAFVNDAPASLKRGMRLTLPRQIPARRPVQTAVPTGSVRSASAAATSPRTPSVTVPALPSPTAAVAAAAAPRAPAEPAPAPRIAPAATPPTRPQPAPAPQPAAPPPVAALPPPVAQPAPPPEPAPVEAEQETSERPPWWWTLSALAVALLVL